MRVLIDGGVPGSRGYMRVLRGILSTGRVPPDTEVHLLCSPEFPRILGDFEDRVETVIEPALSAPSRRTRATWWMRSYPGLVRRLAPDVILHPVGFKRGVSSGVPSVVRATTMLPFDRREIFRYGLSRQTLFLLRQRRRLARSFQRADGVICLSDHSHKAILDQVPGIKNSAVIPNGLEPNFKAKMTNRRILNDPVKILYVSTINPYKHQWNVVEAVSMLRDRLGLDLRLDLVGGGEAIAQRKLDRRIRELGAAHFTTITGDLSLDAMAAVYREADIFVFASSCEGCPNTLIEAMGSALPIACSGRMSMPAVLGDGGVYFDPEEPESIARAVDKLLKDPDLRQKCSARASKRAEEYTWERTAILTYDFLRDASQMRSRS